MVKITLLAMSTLHIYCLPNQLIYLNLSHIFLSIIINYNTQSVVREILGSTSAALGPLHLHLTRFDTVIRG